MLTDILEIFADAQRLSGVPWEDAQSGSLTVATSDSKRQLYQSRRDAGLCADCGMPSKAARCLPCRRYYRARRQTKLVAGECTECAGRAVPGYVVCEVHRAAEVRRRASKNAKTKEWYAAKRASGGCTKCGKQLDRAGCLCSVCHPVVRERQRALRALRKLRHA